MARSDENRLNSERRFISGCVLQRDSRTAQPLREVQSASYHIGPSFQGCWNDFLRLSFGPVRFLRMTIRLAPAIHWRVLKISMIPCRSASVSHHRRSFTRPRGGTFVLNDAVVGTLCDPTPGDRPGHHSAGSESPSRLICMLEGPAQRHFRSADCN